MKTNWMLSLVAMSAMALCGSARADSINVVLGNSTLTAAAGQTVTFSGTISSPSTNMSTIYINNDNANTSGAGSVDTANAFDDPLLDNYFTLAPGQSQPGDLFTATIDPDALDGTFTGSFLIFGGANSDAMDTLATVDFTVDIVNTPAAVTPEPPSVLLLASGLLCAAVLGWRGRATLA